MQKGRRAIVWCDPKSFKADPLFNDIWSKERNATEGSLQLKIGDIVYVTRSSGERFWSGKIGDKSGTFFRKCVRWLPEEDAPIEVKNEQEIEDYRPIVGQIPRKSSIVVDDIHDHIVQRSGGGDVESSWLEVFGEDEDQKEITGESENVQVDDENEMVENNQSEIEVVGCTTEIQTSKSQILNDTWNDFRFESSSKPSITVKRDTVKERIEERIEAPVGSTLMLEKALKGIKEWTEGSTSMVEKAVARNDTFEIALREVAERECVKRGEALERQRRKFVRTIAMEKKITDGLHEQALRDAVDETANRYETEMNRLRAENLRLLREVDQKEEGNELKEHVMHQQAVHELFDRKLADLHNEHDAEIEEARKLRDEHIERARVHYESSVRSAELEESNRIREHERAIANELDELNEDIAKRELAIESLVPRALDNEKFATELDTETEAVTRDKVERHREIEELDRLRRIQVNSEHENQIRTLEDDHMERKSQAHEDHAKMFRSLSEDLSASVESLRKDSTGNAIHNHFDGMFARLHEEHDENLEKAQRVRDEQIERARDDYESNVQNVRLEESNSIREHERAIANELDELNEDISKRERAIESLVHRALDDVKYASELDDEVSAVTRDKVERHREIEELDRLRRIQNKSKHETQIKALKYAHTEMKHKAHEDHASTFRRLSKSLSSSVHSLRKQRRDSISSGVTDTLERKKSVEMSSISRFAVRLKRHATLAKADALLREDSISTLESLSLEESSKPTNSSVDKSPTPDDDSTFLEAKKSPTPDDDSTLVEAKRDNIQTSGLSKDDRSSIKSNERDSVFNDFKDEEQQENVITDEDLETSLRDLSDLCLDLREDSPSPSSPLNESNSTTHSKQGATLTTPLKDDILNILEDDSQKIETFGDDLDSNNQGSALNDFKEEIESNKKVTDRDHKETSKDLSDLGVDVRDNESEDMTSTMVESKEGNWMVSAQDTTETDSLNMSLKVLMESDFAPVSFESSSINKYEDAMMDVVLSRVQSYGNDTDEGEDIELPPTPPSEMSSSLNDGIRHDGCGLDEKKVSLKQNNDEIVYRNDDSVHIDDDDDVDELQNHSNRSNLSYSQNVRVTSFEEEQNVEDEETQKVIFKLSPIQEQEEYTWRDMKDGHDMRDVISGGGYYGDEESNETTTTFKLYERSRRIHIGNDGITIDLMKQDKNGGDLKKLDDEDEKDLPSRATSSLLDKIDRDSREPKGWWVKF